jgi:dTDP-4-dehydrorhamnose reductase
MEKEKSDMPIWGGIECTIHRVNNSFSNQLIRNGHYERDEDLELIADLGIRTLRYPILWESICPAGLHKADWTWIDSKLDKMKSLGITPIAGLLHHGSGPQYTSLLDPDFAKKFTAFTVAVAQRYPWLEYFTPVNEPLTTARFSCVYGHWYPHARHMFAFAKALLNQSMATVMAMTEIRKIIPNAKLVQTEDLGKCHGTERLRYQWEMENERRWASLDILTGNALRNTFIQKFFLNYPSIKKGLEYFERIPCPPDIIGVNHYITSERFLDHRFDKYPRWARGSNGLDHYADVDIVRADIHARAGHYNLLKETYERYRLPLALTEVHMGATRDEQLRWFMEAYNAATRLSNEGVDVRGVTAWSMFGAYDWNSLLRAQNNHYETGVFDVSSGAPRPTAVAHLIKTLTSKEKAQYQVLCADGWWKNPGVANLWFGTKQEERQLTTVEGISSELPFPTPRPILITGASGTLGQAFARICTIRNLSCVLLSRKDLDIADYESVHKIFKQYEPWAVINAAGFVRVDDAENNPSSCLRENTEGPGKLAAACLRYDSKYLTFSSDLIFDGSKRAPYCEDDKPAPLNIYGISKYLAEFRVMNANPDSLIIRTSSFFGPWDQHNFLAKLYEQLSSGKVFAACDDLVISPTYVPDLVNACLDLIIDYESGIWHITHPAALTWYKLALMATEEARLNTKLVRAVNSRDLMFRAPRPAFSALQSKRGLLMPSLESGICRFVRERRTVMS